MDCNPPGSSVHGVLQARILEWVPFTSPGDISNPGIKPGSPELQALFFFFFNLLSHQSVSSVTQLCDHMIAARQDSLSITNSRSSLKLMSIESVMPSSHLILFYPLLLLPPSLLASESFPMS